MSDEQKFLDLTIIETVQEKDIIDTCSKRKKEHIKLSLIYKMNFKYNFYNLINE